MEDSMSIITSVAELEKLYGEAQETSTAKEVDYITPHYRRFIEASPFVVLATSGPEGLDASPRGDKAGFVRIQDDRTLLLPDRRGNNRVDSLRNIVRDPRVGLLFLVPGSGTTLRVNGRGVLSIDPALLESFAVEEKAPRSVLVLQVESVYFQCARAIMRSELWNPERHVDPKSLPTAGQILAGITAGRVGGEPYDKAWPERAKASMW
jgi:PPOX class probable FMN-dependent enzyme